MAIQPVGRIASELLAQGGSLVTIVDSPPREALSGPGGLKLENVMAVRLRLKRMGRSHRPYYRLHAVDSRSPLDGRVIEQLGTYDPVEKDTEKQVKVDLDRCKYWLDQGAKPTETVSSLLKRKGFEHKGLVFRKVGTHVKKVDPKKKA